MKAVGADPPPSASTSRPTHGGGRRRAVGVIGLLLAGAAAAAGVLAGVTAGLSVFVVESPSMGRAAPVGTLVVTEPVGERAVRVGDVVTYRPPSTDRTTTHRVVRVVPGGFRTRGDINGAEDAWTVRPSMLVGRAVALVPGVGAILRLLPWCGLGLLSLWLLTWPIRESGWRAGSRLLGACVVITGVALLQRPLVNWAVVAQHPVDRGLLATVVSTGLLPLRLDAAHGTSVLMPPGSVAHVHLPADAAGRVRFDVSLGLEPLGWCLLLLLCLTPVIGVLVVGLPPKDGELVRRG